MSFIIALIWIAVGWILRGIWNHEDIERGKQSNRMKTLLEGHVRSTMTTRILGKDGNAEVSGGSSNLAIGGKGGVSFGVGKPGDGGSVSIKGGSGNIAIGGDGSSVT